VRYVFFIVLLTLLIYKRSDSSGKQFMPKPELLKELVDTTDPQSIFGCILEFDAQPYLDDWTTFLQNKLQLDSAALDTIPSGVFTVIAQFEIDKDGKLRDVSIVKDPGYSLGDKVMKVINQYNCLWKPAQFDGHEIKTVRRQPITFVIEEEAKNVCEEEQPPYLIL